MMLYCELHNVCVCVRVCVCVCVCVCVVLDKMLTCLLPVQCVDSPRHVCVNHTPSAHVRVQ